MANENLRPAEFTNPFLPWVEQGLRMFDQSVTTTQNVGDAVDRVARADVTADPPVATAQRNMFELMTQAWVQWMSWFGAMAGLGAKAALPDQVARQVTAAQNAATRIASNGSERQPRSAYREHAAASDEPKRRRSASKTKSRRARRS
jgi:hypothetical protein